MIKAVLFDLDNTLIDFIRMKHMSCEAAIDAMIGAGLEIKHSTATKELFKLYDVHGMEDKTIFQKFLKKLTGKVDYRILATGIVAYRNVRTGFLDPYPNVPAVLLKLKVQGIKLAIVTDAPKLKAWVRLVTMGLDNFFDVVITHDDSKAHKPSPVPFKMAMSKLKVHADECLMVGDWPERDIKGASRLGIKTAWAKYGSLKKSAKADYTLKKFSDILNIVQ